MSIKRITANTIYQLLGKLFSMSVTVLATIIITRIYGKQGFGEFNLMQNIPALFYIIADFGLNAIATREISKSNSPSATTSNYISNVLVIRVVMSLILMALVCVSVVFFPYSFSLKLGIMLGSLTILTQALYATTNIIYQTKHRYDLSTLSYIFGSIYILGSLLLFSYYKVSIAWVNFSYVIGGFITFGVNLAIVKKLGINLMSRFSLDTKLIKTLLIDSMPLGLMFLFSQINFKADSIMLSVLSLPKWLTYNNTESVAIYGLPYKIFEVFLVVPTFFMNSAYPTLVTHMTQGKNKLKQTFWRIMIALFFAGMVTGLCGALLSPVIIKILGGNQFSDSILVLQILLLGVVIFYLTQPISWLIVTLGAQKNLPIIYLVSAVFNVGANLIFIQKYSFYASAVITLLSEFLVLILLILTSLQVWKSKYA